MRLSKQRGPAIVTTTGPYQVTTPELFAALGRHFLARRACRLCRGRRFRGRRLRTGRIHRRSLAALREALSTIAAVPLTAVGRYGPYWVLTFRVATEHLVVLADQLTLLPDWGGPGGRVAVASGPLASAGV